MAEKKEPLVKGSISPNTIAWLLLFAGGGILLWKVIDSLTAGSKAGQELSESIQEEAAEAQQYISTKNYSDEGLQIREVSLNDKLIALETVSENWLERTLNSLAGWLRTLGIYVVWPTAGLVAGYLIYKLIKNWPKNPPTFTCHIDGQTFPSEQALADHTATAHQPQSETQTLNQAQILFNNQPSYVQDAVAVQFVSTTKIYQSWTTLTPQEILNLALSIEIVLGYGIGPGMTSMIPLLIF